MRKMKDSGVEWIGEIPEDWEIRKVKNCFDKRDEKAHQENPIILSLSRDRIKIRDISSNEGQIAESYFNYNVVKIGDLLLNPMDLYSGANCNVSYIEGVISPAYVNLVAKGESDSKYYDYYFKTQYWSMALFAHGKGVSFENRWTLNNETIKNYFIPYPKPNEQYKIRKHLDKKCGEIEELIKIQEQEIEKLGQYKKSVIYEAVTKGLDPNAKMKDSGIVWIGEIPENFNITKLKYKCEIKTGNSIPDEVKDSYVYTEDSVPYISTKDITLNSNKINYVTGIYINLNDKKFKFSKKESILLCVEGGSAGKKVGFTNQEVAFVNKLASIYSKSEINRFIFYSIQSRIFENQFFSKVEGLIGGVGLSDIREFFILLPPTELQSKISSYLDNKCKEIDDLISIKQEKIDKLEEYKKSLIYECVTGKREV